MARGGRGIAAAIAALAGIAACSSHSTANDSPTPVKSSSTARPTTAAANSAADVTACRRHELRARFAGGGFGTGNDFGSIVIWNRAPLPCRVAGSVRFGAFFSDGRRDRNAQSNRSLPSVDVVLPANTPAYRDGANAARYLTADLMGPERDDPAQPDALCREQDKLAPATLVLVLGDLTFRVANSDPRSIQAKQVYGCHGRVLLEGVERPE